MDPIIKLASMGKELSIGAGITTISWWLLYPIASDGRDSHRVGCCIRFFIDHE